MSKLTVASCFFLSSLGCSSTPSISGGGPCKANADCTGAVCIDSACVELCVTQKDCGAEEICGPKGGCIPSVAGPTPVLTTIAGNDSTDDTVVADGVVIIGEHLESAVFELQSTTAGNKAMTVVSQTATSAEVQFPVDVDAGEFTLVATNASGSASSALTLTLPSLSGAEILTRLNGASGTISLSLLPSHVHSAADVSSGVLDLARLPTGTSTTTVALGDHGHDAGALSSGIIDQARLPAPLTHGGNYIPSTGLNDLTGWSAAVNGTAANTTSTAISLVPVTDGPSGANAIQNNTGEVAWVSSDTWVRLSRNSTYRVQASFKRMDAAGTGAVYMVVRLRDKDGVEIDGTVANGGLGGQWWFYPVAASQLPSEGAWFPFDSEFGYGTRAEFPANATQMSVGVILNFVTGDTGGNHTYQAQDFGIFDAPRRTRWIAFPYASGKTAYAITNSSPRWTLPSYRRIGDQVCMRGLVEGVGAGTGATSIIAGTIGTTIGTLPGGFRPAKQLLFFVGGHTNGDRVDVGPSGAVTASIGDDSTWTSLDGICFSTSP